MKKGRRKLLTNGYWLLTILIAVLFLLPLCANATIYEWTSGTYEITIVDDYSADWVNLRNSAVVNMTGGTLGVLYAYDTSKFNFQGGHTGQILQFYGNSVANISGGTISGGFTMHDNSIINVTGGTFQGGSVSISLANSGSILNISGGNTTSMGYIAPGEGIINIYGYDLSLEPVIPSPTCGNTTKVTGFWADGSPFTLMLARIEYTAPNIVLHEIPEPCMLSLIGFGFLVLRRNIKTFRK